MDTNFTQQSRQNEEKMLKYYTDKANYEATQQQENQQIINLSLVEIAAKISQTAIAVINELVDPEKPKDLNGLITILFKEDRMVYIGITVILLSLGVYLIDITS